MEDAALTFWQTLGNGWNWYWFVTKNYAISTGIIMMIGTISYVLFSSLKLNYYYYIKHGQVVLFCDVSTEHDYKARIKKIAKEHNIWFDHEFLPWIQAFIFSIISCVVIFLLALIWPITSITVLPLFIVKLIAYRKRKKIVFLQKLEGKND